MNQSVAFLKPATYQPLNGVWRSLLVAFAAAWCRLTWNQREILDRVTTPARGRSHTPGMLKVLNLWLKPFGCRVELALHREWGPQCRPTLELILFGNRELDFKAYRLEATIHGRYWYMEECAPAYTTPGGRIVYRPTARWYTLSPHDGTYTAYSRSEWLWSGNVGEPPVYRVAKPTRHAQL